MLKRIFLLLFPLLAFAACNLSTTMFVTPAKQEVPATGATFTISLITTDENPSWTAECDSVWVTISPELGNGDATITISVAKNPRMAARAAAVAIRGMSSSVFMYILQAANDKDETGGNGGNGGDNGGNGDTPYTGPCFKVHDGVKVVFAPGNLQYCPSQDRWRFAEHQYDMIGYDNDYISSTYGGYIDLFGWGTSGFHSCVPYLATLDNAQYGPQGDYDLTGEYAVYDWGVYNNSQIVNNPDPSYQWRLLESWNWGYIIEHNQHTLATVCGVPGMLIFPEGFEVTPDEISYEDYLHKIVNDESYLTNNGLVFLPAAGRREGSTCIRETTGWYHSSTSAPSSTFASGCSIMEFYSSRDDEYGIGEATTVGEPYGRHYGCAVRLVREVK